MIRSPDDDAAPRRRAGRPRARSLLLAACAAAVLAAPGCCLQFGRSDGPSSLRFATGSMADRTEEDARATAAYFSGLPSRIADDVAETPARFRTACNLYFGE